MHATIHEGNEVSKGLCFGLTRTVLQTIIPETECTRAVCGHKIWWCLSLPVWCLTSCMLQAPCTASVASSAWAATPAFTTLAEDTKSLVVDRKLDRNSRVTFHLNYSGLFFPPGLLSVETSATSPRPCCFLSLHTLSQQQGYPAVKYLPALGRCVRVSWTQLIASGSILCPIILALYHRIIFCPI